MNEGSGGTPNPLNPNPTQPGQQAQPAQVNPAQMTPDGNVIVPSLDPDGRPMVQVPTQVEVPPKEKKTGLIVGIIVAIIALIGGGVAAAILLLGGQGDAVAAAMDKIMSGDAPANVVVDGTIDLVYNDDNSVISQIKIDFDSDMIPGTMVNSSRANLVISTIYGDDYVVEFDEVYADGGDLYFKITGASDALADSDLLDLLLYGSTGYRPKDCMVTSSEGKCIDIIEDCVSEEEGGCDESTVSSGTLTNDDTMERISLIASVLEFIDDEWLHISTSDLSQLSGDDSMGWLLPTSNISCVVDLVSDINKGSDSAAELYRKYPFVSSTNKDLTIDSVKDPIYKISIDSEKFANYMNSIQGNELAQEAFDCLGWNNNVSVTAGDVDKVVAAMPITYAEVDKDNNFTRLYVESDIVPENDDCYCPEDAVCSTCLETEMATTTVKIDIRFSYPSSLEVEEPSEYTDFSDMITQVMLSLFNLDYTEEVDY